MTDKAKVAVAGGLITLDCVLFVWQRQHAPSAVQEPQRVPASGLVENNTGGTVPGNPENTFADFKEIYAVINKYGELTQGSFPKGMGDFYRVNGGLKASGYATPDDFLRMFFNRWIDDLPITSSVTNLVSTIRQLTHRRTARRTAMTYFR